MNPHLRVAASAVVLLFCVSVAVSASEPTAAAMDFWKALVKGDVAEMEGHYAEEVVLRAGSEFLNKEWGLNPSGDRYKEDVKVKRADLMKAYTAMLEKAGKDKWTKLFGSIPESQVTAKPLPNSRVLLTVQTKPGDDRLEFELAPNADQSRWLVVSEHTDY